MKKLIVTLIITALLLSVMTVPGYADNPIVQTSFTPDPAPVVFDDVLYLYCGEDSTQDNGFYNMTGWRCYSTTDMVNWTDHGLLMYSESFEWADPGTAWAAQCIERNGKYYLYVTVTNSGGRAIGVAVSDSPTGPFVDALGGPLCGPNWSYIDPTVMIDDDGQAYLYFGNPTSYYCLLNEDMISLASPVMEHPMTTEAFGVGPNGGTTYTEGPWLYKREGIYYLVYASLGVPEGISYSTSDSPTGPWKYKGEIMEPYESTTIHPGIIEYKGHNYFFYHGVLLENGGWNKRSTAIVEFDYKKDGSIPLLKHSEKGVSQLENFNPYKKNEAETINYCEKVRTAEGGTKLVAEIAGEGYIKVAGVDFAGGADSFTASLATSGKGTLEIHLDKPDGKKVGEIEMVQGDKEDFKDYTCDISGAKGVHDLYFVYNSTSGPRLRFDNWSFNGDSNGVSISSSGSAPVLPIVIAAAVVIVIAAAAIIILKKKKA